MGMTAINDAGEIRLFRGDLPDGWTEHAPVAKRPLERIISPAEFAGMMGATNIGGKFLDQIWTALDDHVTTAALTGDPAMIALRSQLASQRNQSGYRLEKTVAEVVALAPLVLAVTGITITEQDIRDAWPD